MTIDSYSPTDLVSINLPRHERDKLRILAAQHGVSMVKMLARLVADATKGIKLKTPRGTHEH